MQLNPRKTRRTGRIIEERRGAWLIGCEGTKTEPLYINGVLNWLRVNGFHPPRIDAIGCGYNTLSLVERVNKLFDDIDRQKAKGVKYEKVFVVFDRDSFPSDKFNRAIYRCHKNGYSPIWSNESFELWFYLHFQFNGAQLTREQYCDLVSRELQSIGYEKDYEKADEEIAILLMQHNRFQDAIRHSNRLRENSKHIRSFVQRNPATEVDILLIDILQESGYPL